MIIGRKNRDGKIIKPRKRRPGRIQSQKLSFVKREENRTILIMSVSKLSSKFTVIVQSKLTKEIGVYDYGRNR